MDAYYRITASTGSVWRPRGEENGGSVTEAYRGVEHVEHFDGGVFVGGASDVHRLDVRRVVEVDQFFGDLGDWEGANQVSKSGDKTYIKEWFIDCIFIGLILDGYKWLRSNFFIELYLVRF